MSTRAGRVLVSATARGTIAAVLAGPIVAPLAMAGDGYPWSAAPAPARSRVNPYADNPDAVRAGRKLFARHCSECHGAGGSGGRNAPPLSSGNVSRAAPGEMFWFLTNGRLGAGMPSWSALPEARRWQIVAFLATLDPAAGPALAPDSRGPRGILGDHSFVSSRR